MFTGLNPHGIEPNRIAPKELNHCEHRSLNKFSIKSTFLLETIQKIISYKPVIVLLI